MRKRLITPAPESTRTRGESWLDVERQAVVEVTSEDKNYLVESAFVSGDAQGWRAAVPGSQTIRLVFDHPQRLRCISLVFEESETARTQEFVLRWSPDGGNSVKEIVRQQWNFSPPDSVREVEEYQVELSAVTILELIINPNISGGVARASLKNLRLSLCCARVFAVRRETVYYLPFDLRLEKTPEASEQVGTIWVPLLQT